MRIKIVLLFCFRNIFDSIKSDIYLGMEFITSLTVMFLTIGMTIATPLFFKNLVDVLESKTPNSLTLMLSLSVYGGCWAMAHVSCHIRDILGTRVLERAIHFINLKFYKSILDNPIKIAQNLTNSGSVVSQIILFNEGFRNLIWGSVFFFFPLVAEIFLACFVLFYLYGWSYMIFFFILVFLFGLVTIFSIPRYLQYQKNTHDHISYIYGFLGDRLSNLETVALYGRKERETEMFDEMLKKLEDYETKSRRSIENIRLLQGTIISFGLILITYFTTYFVSQGERTLSDFILINSYIIQLVSPLSALGLIANDVYKSFSAIANAIACFDISDTFHNRPSIRRKKLNEFKSLRAENLSFFYKEEDTEIGFKISNIGFELKPESVLGIVGLSGSGKSTLARILGGLYLPSQGRLFVNEEDISVFEPDSFKDFISLVPQQVQIFNASVRENILYANPNAASKDLEDILHYATLDKLVARLDQGLETRIGNSGSILSGGERQRLGIARLLIKKPSVAIFDESTSFLDSHTESLIFENIQKVMSNLTKIIITHRLPLIKNAGRILVMHDGRVINQGNHHYLISNCPLYKDLWDKYNQSELKGKVA